MRIITIIGARPQFVKAAMVSRAIMQHNQSSPEKIEELLLHTGQHYDTEMSQIFFTDMHIPTPTWQLHCGNHSHGAMTGEMLIEIEKILQNHHPDYVLVYGDTNSTLAGALAASKLHIPVIHVEAGLRSFNKQMPEEINRILTDHVSTLLCCPTYTAITNLENEGIKEGVHHVGDVMYDAALLFSKLADQLSTILQRLPIEDIPFRLLTLHRAENTDDQQRLSSIVKAIMEMATTATPVVWPLHPRTKKYLESYHLLESISTHPGIYLIPPIGFLDMVMLEKRASTILTDSGGIQKEAYFHHTPCITLREETEWVETLSAGWNQLAGFKTENILQCLTNNLEKKSIDEFGSGKAAHKIISLL